MDIKPLGAHEIIITHLTHSQDKVACQAMAILVTLLYNGNKRYQQSIGQCMRNQDTEMFTRMDALLELGTALTKADSRR